MEKKDPKKRAKKPEKGKPKVQLFENKRCAFILMGKEMSAKRNEVLSNQFREQGGKLLNLDIRTKHSLIQQIVDDKHGKGVLQKLDFIVTSRPEGKKKLEVDKIAEQMHVDSSFLASMLQSEKLRIVSPEWLSESFKSGKVADMQPYTIKAKGKKSSSSAHEEENKDQVVSLDEIIGDVYKMKYGSKKRKNMKDEEEEKKEQDSQGEGLKSSVSHKSKYFVDGEEYYSDDSYLFQWKPEFVQKQEEFWDKKKEKFACMKGSQKKEEEQPQEQQVMKKAYNEEIIKELDKLHKYYSGEGDKGRAFGYRKAVTFLRSYKEPIETVEQLDNVPYIGDGIKKKIKEFLESGIIKRFEFLSHDPKVQAVEALSEVWGVGPKNAAKLYSQGIKGVEDLRKKPHLLTDMQKIGLKYYEDFKQKIPRDEVTKLQDRVRKACYELYKDGKKNMIIEAVGSYRRGKDFCGDIDILITRKDGAKIEGIMEKVVVKLEKEGFLKERLGSLRYSHMGSEGYMGVCQLSKDHPNRRIDMKSYPLDQYGFALLYFTGSGNFNRSMRLFAQKKGYSLSDYGLTPVMKAKGKTVAEFNSIPCATEEDVFKALNMDYKTPQERDI